MIGAFVTGLGTAATLATAGLVLGWGYFAALRWSVERYCAGGRALSTGALTLGRLAMAVGFFALAARWGALPLLAALAGFLVSRALAVRAARSAGA